MLTPLQATKAPDRCWQTYRRCSVTGISGIGGRKEKPKDIVAAHIFQYAYRRLVCCCLSDGRYVKIDLSSVAIRPVGGALRGPRANR
jgi:hypothetical protein